MSKPREKWWGYVKAMIRAYPELKKKYEVLHEPSMQINLTGLPTAHNATSSTERIALRELNPTEQRELDAVSAAIKATSRMYGGDSRLRIIDLIYWRQTHTLDGAALNVHVSIPTAKRWNGAFIYLVAEKYGLNKTKVDTQEPKKGDNMVS